MSADKPSFSREEQVAVREAVAGAEGGSAVSEEAPDIDLESFINRIRGDKQRREQAQLVLAESLKLMAGVEKTVFASIYALMLKQRRQAGKGEPLSAELKAELVNAVELVKANARLVEEVVSNINSNLVIYMICFGPKAGGILSHDLKNVTSPLRANLEMVKELSPGDLEEKQNEFVDDLYYFATAWSRLVCAFGDNVGGALNATRFNAVQRSLEGFRISVYNLHRKVTLG